MRIGTSVVVLPNEMQPSIEGMTGKVVARSYRKWVRIRLDAHKMPLGEDGKGWFLPTVAVTPDGNRCWPYRVSEYNNELGGYVVWRDVFANREMKCTLDQAIVAHRVGVFVERECAQFLANAYNFRYGLPHTSLEDNRG